MSDNTEKKHPTNFWDVIKTIVNGFFNLFRIEKIMCLIVAYLIYRDNYFFHKLPANSDLTKYLIDTNIINKIFDTNDTLTIVLFAVIVVCVAIIIIQIVVTRLVYVKEINRLTAERKELIHGIGTGSHEYIKLHRSSDQ